MPTVNWPSTLRPEAFDYAVEFDVQMTVSRSGKVYTYGLPGARWVATLTFPSDSETMTRPALEALLVSLEGGTNRLAMPHFGRPTPNGTLTGSPTVATTTAAGAKVLPFANANGTLRKGDIFGVGGQLCMVTADATPNSGSMNVSFAPALRAQVTGGAAITWNRPTIQWVPRTSIAGPFPFRAGKHRPGFSVEFVEAYA